MATLALTDQFQAQAREAWDKSIVEEVYMAVPLLNVLMERKVQEVLDPGTAFKTTARVATIQNLGSDYGVNTALAGGQATTLTTLLWYPKDHQIPLEVPTQIVDRAKGGGVSILHDPKEVLISEGQESMKLWFNAMLWGEASPTLATLTAADGVQGIAWQGLQHALYMDGSGNGATYGGAARTATSNALLLGGSLNGAYTDQNTAFSPTIDNTRAMFQCITRRTKNRNPKDVVAFWGDVNWRYLRSQVEQSTSFKAGNRMQYGIQSFSIDDVEHFADPYLVADTTIHPAGDGATFAAMGAMLNLNDVHLKINPTNKFGSMLPWTDLRGIPGCKPVYFSRALLTGAFFIEKPNGSILKTNVA